MSDSNIDQLINLCRAGDACAVEIFVHTYQHIMFRLAISILGDPAEAEDATQEAIVTALRALNSFRGDSNFKTWLYAITLNVCRGRLRQRRRRERLKQALNAIFHQGGHDRSHPEEATIQRDTDTRVWRAILALNENHRLPVILRYYHDLSVAQIAQILGISEGTVHSRLHNARERLRISLRDEVDVS